MKTPTSIWRAISMLGFACSAFSAVSAALRDEVITSFLFVGLMYYSLWFLEGPAKPRKK